MIGGGLPIGAVGGRREVMETLTPLGTVFHAGTLAGNPIATAAGLAALDLLDADVYIELAARARHLAALLRDACAAAGFPAQFPVVGTLVGMVCGDGVAPVDFDGAKRTDEAAYAAFFQAMLAEGVAMAPGAYEAIFVGLGHDDAVLDDLAERAGTSRRRRRRAPRLSAGATGRARRCAASGGRAASSVPADAAGDLVAVRRDHRRAARPDGRRSTSRSATTVGGRGDPGGGAADPPHADLISIVLGTTRDGFASRAADHDRHAHDAGAAGRLHRRRCRSPSSPARPARSRAPTSTTPCALLAETLGDTVSWFALVPMGADFRFELPAVEELDGGYANLVNGWQVPYATVIDRRCESQPGPPAGEPPSRSASSCACGPNHPLALRPRPRRPHRRHC